jgi:hypothetical protein
MIDLLQLQQYLEHLKENVPAINTAKLAIDDTQITAIVRDLKESDNLILLAIVPSHKLQGQDEDDVHTLDQLAFLVLKKVDRKVSHADFIINLHSCQVAAKEVVSRLIIDKTEYNDGCSFLNRLSVSSFKIDPVFALAGTDGYEIEFLLQTYL